MRLQSALTVRSPVKNRIITALSFSLTALASHCPNGRLHHRAGRPPSRIRRSSARFAGFIVYPCLVRDPVYFPGFATILRERLFEVRRIRVGLRPNESNQDGTAIWARRFRGVKLAASILEFADRGHAHGSPLAGPPIKAPPSAFRFIQTQRPPFHSPS